MAPSLASNHAASLALVQHRPHPLQVSHRGYARPVPGSFRVARVLGIDIRIHISWLLIFFLVLLQLADQVFPASYPQWSQQKTFIVAAVAALLIFPSVLL